MEEYDPLKAPDPEEWRETDASERLFIVKEYHRRACVKLPNATVHATFHTVVENQLAEPIPEVVEVLNRLMEEGLDRHDAIHAIGSVVANYVFSVLRDEGPSDANESYLRELKDLTAEKWLASFE